MKKIYKVLIVIFLLPVFLYGQEKDKLNDEYSLKERTGKMATNYPIKSISSHPLDMNPNASVIISPSGNGGFESGTNFSANGWTEVQSSYNKWYVSTLNPPGPTQGSREAITGTSSTNWNGQARSTINHIYRNFSVPSGETKIILTFNYRIQNADVNNDFLSVHVVPTSTTPSAGNLLSTGEVLILTDVQTTYVRVCVSLDPSYAGTSKRLVFSWRTNGSSPNASFAIDEISMTSSAMTTITSTATGGNWSETSTWVGGIVPEGDNVIINGPVFVDNSYYCNNLTVNSGTTLETADIKDLQLTVIGIFTVISGATIDIGGYYGGRLVISGTGKSHSISGIINILWALRFDYPAGGTSNSTVSVSSGAVITNDAAADGQLCLEHSVIMTFAAGSELYNYNNITSQGFCGLNLLLNGRLIINGILTNGTNGSFYTDDVNSLTVNGTLNYSSGYWTTSASGQQCNPIIYGSSATLAYTGGSLTTTNYEWPVSNVPYNIIINSTGNITLHTNKTISGILYLMQGNFVNGTRLTMVNGTTINRSNGSISAFPTLNTNCNVIYSNTIDITSGYELPSAATTFLNNLTFQGTATVTLSANATVKGTATLTMAGGNINTGAYTLMLGTGAGARGTLDYVSGNIITGANGGFKRWFTNTTVSNVLFPVGTSANINMIKLSFTGAPSAGGSLTAKFIPSNPGTNVVTEINDAGYVIDCYSQIGYWQIDAANGLTGGTYNLSLRGQGFNPLGNEITNFVNLRILKRTNGSGNNWTATGSHANAIEYSNSDPVIRRNGLSGFSQFAMGGNAIDGNPLSGPLPVELSSFTANVISKDVKLNWATASEINNAGFEVERSEVGSQNSEFRKISFVSGNGTKSTPTYYSFEDKKLNTGKYNYRLKQIDYNGNFEYFDLKTVVEIGVPGKFEMSQNYPNPFNPITKIDFDLPYESNVSIKLYDMSGREVMTILNEQKPAGYYTVQLNGNNLSSGTYFYRIIAEGNGQNYVMTKKAILIK